MTPPNDFIANRQGHRYYNPSTGRWLSRDPINEDSFRKQLSSQQLAIEILLNAKRVGLNDYLFLGNHPQDEIDVLGLAGCCGPDVTAPMQKTLAEIESTYRHWNTLQKFVSCVTIADAPVGWDVEKISDLGFFAESFRFKPPAVQGTGDCTQTVAYKGKCYYSSAVNYLAYGKMNSLCSVTFPSGVVPPPPLNFAILNDWRLPATLTRVAAWKEIRYLGSQPFRLWISLRVVTLAADRLGAAVRIARFCREMLHRTTGSTGLGCHSIHRSG